MRTVILGPRPPEIDALIARRQALGIDRFDEIWEGDYHMAPAAHPRHGVVTMMIGDLLKAPADAAGLIRSTDFNVGEQDNFRVPDLGFHRSMPTTVYVPTAALIVEVLSPGDDTWEKFPHYAACGVREIVVADPDRHTVVWFELTGEGDRYEQVERSSLLGVTAAAIQAGIDWP